MREDVDGRHPDRSGNTLQWDAFEALQPGQVLVVDSYRTATAASGGDTCTTRAWKRGRRRAGGTHGGLRDGTRVGAAAFPTYASLGTITTRAAQHHVANASTCHRLRGGGRVPGTCSSAIGTGCW